MCEKRWPPPPPLSCRPPFFLFLSRRNPLSGLFWLLLLLLQLNILVRTLMDDEPSDWILCRAKGPGVSEFSLQSPHNAQWPQIPLIQKCRQLLIVNAAGSQSIYLNNTRGCKDALCSSREENLLIRKSRSEVCELRVSHGVCCLYSV